MQVLSEENLSLSVSLKSDPALWNRKPDIQDFVKQVGDPEVVRCSASRRICFFSSQVSLNINGNMFQHLEYSRHGSHCPYFLASSHSASDSFFPIVFRENRCSKRPAAICTKKNWQMVVSFDRESYRKKFVRDQADIVAHILKSYHLVSILWGTVLKNRLHLIKETKVLEHCFWSLSNIISNQSMGIVGGIRASFYKTWGKS